MNKKRQPINMLRLLTLVLIAILVSAAQSQTDYVVLSSNPFYEQGFTDLPSGGNLIQVYVLVMSRWGLTGIEFAAPPPDCSTGLVLLNQSPVFPETYGSIETGISINFGGCRSSRVNVLTLTFFSTSALDSCCPWDIVPHPNSMSGEIEGVDCNSQVVYVDGLMNTFRPVGMAGCGCPTVPQNPVPSDLSDDQPLMVTLDWDSEPTAGTGLGVFFGNVHFGLTPDEPIAFWNLLPPLQIGPLEPNTTYYWKVVSWVPAYGGTPGPVWQFTTGSDLSVRKSTWGKIKSIYRD